MRPCGSSTRRPPRSRCSSSDPDRLEFRVAAGEQGAGAVGLTVPPTQGIAGFVYSTGQALALSDVASDPRFNRDAAEQTGYVPRSIAAAPLLDEHSTVGVLQVLDKRSSPTFSLQDMELLGVFAGQATVAIAAARVQRDTERLLRSVLTRIEPGLGADQVEDARRRRHAGSGRRRSGAVLAAGGPVARLRALTDRETSLLADILEVVAAPRGRSAAAAGGRDGERAAPGVVGALRGAQARAASQPSSPRGDARVGVGWVPPARACAWGSSTRAWRTITRCCTAASSRTSRSRSPRTALSWLRTGR